MDDEEEHEVDSIVGHKFEDDSQYFKIRWANHNASEESWVLEEMLSCPQILRKYKKKFSIKTSAKKPIAAKIKKSRAMPTPNFEITPKKPAKATATKTAKSTPDAEITAEETTRTYGIYFLDFISRSRCFHLFQRFMHQQSIGFHACSTLFVCSVLLSCYCCCI